MVISNWVNMAEKGYEFINHTADLGILLYGKDLKELFGNAAYALSDIITDVSRINEKITKEIKVEGMDLEQLMINWLSELLYYYEVDSLIFKRYAIIYINKVAKNQKQSFFTLKAKAYGEKFDLERHIINTEIKAVTYHQIEVRKDNDRWRVRIIFDL